MNLPAERKRSLVCRCWDVVLAEPLGPRQERLRFEVAYWERALADSEEANAQVSEWLVIHHLEEFLKRNEPPKKTPDAVGIPAVDNQQ